MQMVDCTGPDSWLVDSGLGNAAALSGYYGTHPDLFNNVANALGQYSYVDAETNNVLMIPEDGDRGGKAKYLVGSSKGGAVFTIDAASGAILHLHSVGQQPTSALGVDAPMNFGGICYPGSGDVVVLATTAPDANGNENFLFVIEGKEPVLMEKGKSALVGYVGCCPSHPLFAVQTVCVLGCVPPLSNPFVCSRLRSPSMYKRALAHARAQVDPLP